MTQETFENYFFMFHINNYEKESVKIGLLDEDVLLSYEDKDRELNSWIKVLKEHDKKAAQINFVKDYVVINLKKKEGGFWEDKGWRKEEYNNEFQTKMRLYEEEKQRDEIQEQNKKESEKAAIKEEEEKNKDKESMNGEQENKEKEGEEVDDQEKDEKEVQKIEERFVEKRSINFINFDRNSLVFQLD